MGGVDAGSGCRADFSQSCERHDAHQPGGNAAISTKLVAGQVGLEKAVLGDRLRRVAVGKGEGDKTEYLWPVLPDQGVNIFQLRDMLLSRE